MSVPSKQGLYDPAHEHDSCGVGFVANIKGHKSHATIGRGLEILINLDHRGAVGRDPLLGDGAGILIQIPDALLRDWAESQGLTLPPAGDYAVAMCFLPQDEAARAFAIAHFEGFIAKEGQILIGWREVPTDTTGLGQAVLDQLPVIRQAIIGRGDATPDQDAFERKLLVIRKQTQNPLAELAEAKKLPGLDDLYMPSFSSRTIVYKGLLLAGQVGTFYMDLRDPLTTSALALVHQRFSTNTFPSWKLAHPYRFIAHNGEINTVRGNVNWMNARRRTMESELIGADLDKMWPIIPHGQSDTACLDNALELLLVGGYPLAHAVMMLIPEAWSGNPLMDPGRKAFYEYHAALMEPWDGPAAIAFTDGRQIGASLDRNGLRPARFCVTDDDHVIMASESGVLPVKEDNIVRKWRLQPGKMLLIDMEQGRIIEDEEIKADLAAAHPYAEWLDAAQYKLKDLDDVAVDEPALANDQSDLLDRQQAFGYTQEDVMKILEPMAVVGEDPIGSMGTDTPIAVLSARPRLLFDYFKQNFAQVTNPPIDPIREELVMSLVSMIGPRPNLLGHEAGTHKRLEVDQPVLTNADIAKIRSVEAALDGAFRTATIDITWDAASGAAGLEEAIREMCWAATEAVLADRNILILSDRAQGPERIAMPALLATAAVHHHLVRQGLRMQTGLVVETGEAREVHHFCVLAGYGAEAVNPYLAFETLEEIRVRKGLPLSAYELQKNYIKAVGKGILKVMSKMGVSTYQSYCGAQIFDALGLATPFVEKYFTGTATTIEGVGLAEIAEETVRRHATAYGDSPIYKSMLDVGGMYAFRLRGEEHAWTPESVSKLQHAVRGNKPKDYEEFARSINEQSERLLTIRGLMDLKPADKPLDISEVEPAAEIVKRFATGAMSFGSISREAHTTLAIAMNRIGARSNTGEGGEEADRFKPLPNGDSMRSAIKQVASGRFGVTAEYLVNADDIQIKMAQGAKPGEGGQLPGDKVDVNIARVRHSTPGVGLISPPPHHDIYSIEDLAQLIHDLKNVNTKARISVKLVSEVGVGTVAAGVSKARADHVTISGYEGGTGASPLTSLTHAGSPWEIGLAETQQTLLLNGLRSRIAVQVDGGLRTGRDVAIGALLGADEFGFATAPLIAAGCIMMRKCHLNTCPVGVATQDPVLRARFTGQPEHVINFFFFVAEDLRQIMAEMGFRTLDEMIGRVDRLDTHRALDHWKAQGVDLSRLLHKVDIPAEEPLHRTEAQNHGLDKAVDNALIAAAAPALDHGEAVRIQREIRNINRTVGAMLSGEVARRYGHEGLPDNTIQIACTGVGGQSFGAFLAHGITLDLTGDANDYVGKGLSGGRVIVKQPSHVKREPTENIIVGNTVLYGAIAGEAYFNGVAGERFAVRNSGAIAVVEGTGDHGCEYMTGGVVAVLGKTGRNFAAGMSGGIAYVYDEDGLFRQRCNLAMVDVDTIAIDAAARDGAARPRQRAAGVHDYGMGDILYHDAERLRILLERHHLYTGSTRARALLDDWAASLAHFVRVMPRDFARALKKIEADLLVDARFRPTDFVRSISVGKVTGFLELERKDRVYRDPKERLSHYKEFVVPLAEPALRDQASRCMNCGIPFCHNGCPVNNIIPDWNDLVYQGDWQSALEVLHSTNNFPEFTGRICPAPCEASCTLNIDDVPVTIKSIECAIVDRGWEEGWITPQPPVRKTGKSVAVVGSGPAGMACAQQLARAGHSVTLFEKNDRMGGLLRYGIPDFKMEKHLVNRRLVQMEAEGVELRPSTEVGVTVSVESLRENFDAIVMSGGAEQPRQLDIPGAEMTGVRLAMEFLTQQNKRNAGDDELRAAPRGTISAAGKHVIVIGGGDTGSDCVGTSNRQGAASVTQIEIMPKPPVRENKALVWPDWPMKLRTSSSHEEGCERDWAILTKRVTGTNGVVEGLECVRVEWVDGKMQEIPGSEFTLKADVIFLAMGFLGPRKAGFVEKAEVALDARGNVQANMTDYQTSQEGIFACGDMRRGQSLVVWAIREGRQCASAVDLFLMGETELPR